MDLRSQLVAVALLAFICVALAGSTATRNGFDLPAASVSIDAIHAGGPARDGIPAIDQPRFVSTAEAGWLRPEDPVLGVVHNGVSKAYPIAILNWHEIVNDRFDRRAVAVTWYPLCGSGMAFASEVDGCRLDFGVSGLLYNSDMLLYDRESDSLWSQIAGAAISGPYTGERLNPLPVRQTNWADWLARHPETRALSRQTGYQRDYERSPYAGYGQSRELYFPVAFRASGYHPKEQVLGVEVAGRFKAYPFAELARGTGSVSDEFGGKRIEVRFDARHRSAAVFDEQGVELPGVTLFWFAWYAFHPDTAVYRASDLIESGAGASADLSAGGGC